MLNENIGSNNSRKTNKANSIMFQNNLKNKFTYKL